jgi:hypothetical protein
VSWVLDLERAYVAAHTSGVPYPREASLRGLAGAGAVASRYLAVGTPRSFAVISEDPAAVALDVEAHRTWFQIRDVRATCAAPDSREVTLAEALASDIVCIHAPLALAASQLRRGTHVNCLARVTLDDDLEHVAKLWDEPHGLPVLSAGIVDGRQLDEITIFFAMV